MIKLNRNKKDLDNLNLFVHSLPKGKNDVCYIKKIYENIFKTDGWMRNFEDVLYFLEKMDYVKLQHKNDIIVSISLLSKNVKLFKNMNEEIHYEWNLGTKYISNFLKNIDL